MDGIDYSLRLPPLTEGTVLKNGQYEIIGSTVNAGGFGRIYRAYGSRYEENGERHVVAIKEFYVNEFQDHLDSSVSCGTYTKAGIEGQIRLMRSKFREEAELLERLNQQHDRHVPQVHGKAFLDGGRLFYAMTFIDGPTLTQFVEKNGSLSEEQAIDYIVQIGKVLYKAHKWGLIHSDISPNNIMLQGNFAILVDFGNAKSYDLCFQSVDIPRQNQVMEIPGTPGFSPAPEYIGSPEGDIYSLAATLFYLLTGERVRPLTEKYGFKSIVKQLSERKVSEETITAIRNALDLQSGNTMDARKFLSELPREIVFNTLLNYNDYDYDK